MQSCFFVIAAPPPSYESLFGKMKAAKEQSSGKVDLGKSICVILLGTCKWPFTSVGHQA